MKVSLAICKYIFVVAIMSVIFIVESCSRQAETVSAEEMAEQMEAADAGREAARAIINREWQDSMQLQNAILEARAKNSKYELEGKKNSKSAFDSAFFNTIRTVRPDLADQLRP